jgi:hypothetical protein
MFAAYSPRRAVTSVLAEKMKRRKRQLVLNKGSEKFIFRYEVGRENELLDALIDHAKNSRADFDWFDAAVLSFKLTQSLICQADKLLEIDGQKMTI